MVAKSSNLPDTLEKRGKWNRSRFRKIELNILGKHRRKRL